MPNLEKAAQVCVQTEELLTARSCGEELSVEMERATEQHLAGCASCRAFAELLGAGEALLSAPETTGPFEFGAREMAERVVRRIHTDSETAAGAKPGAASRIAWRPAAAAAAALIVLLQAALLWHLLLRPGNEEREVAELRRELQQVREQLDRETVGGQEMREALARGRRQDEALEVIRLVYSPDGAPGAREGEAAGLLDVLQGTTLFSSGKYEPAALLFRRAGERFATPRYKVLTLFALGASLKCAEQHEAAIETYDRVLQLLETEGGTSFPRAGAVLQGIGEQAGSSRPQAHAQNAPPPGTVGPVPGAPPYAEESSWQAMALHFKGWSCYCLAVRAARASVQTEAEARLGQALRHYKQALELAPRYAKVRLNLWKLHLLRAELRAGQERADEQAEAELQMKLAETELRWQCAARPSDAKARFTLAMLFSLRQRDAEALAQLQEAVRLRSALAYLLASEQAFRRLNDQPGYRELLRQAEGLEARATMESLFTDAEFPEPETARWR